MGVLSGPLHLSWTLTEIANRLEGEQQLTDLIQVAEDTQRSVMMKGDRWWQARFNSSYSLGRSLQGRTCNCQTKQSVQTSTKQLAKADHDWERPMHMAEVAHDCDCFLNQYLEPIQAMFDSICPLRFCST